MQNPSGIQTESLRAGGAGWRASGRWVSGRAAGEGQPGGERAGGRMGGRVGGWQAGGRAGGRAGRECAWADPAWDPKRSVFLAQGWHKVRHKVGTRSGSSLRAQGRFSRILRVPYRPDFGVHWEAMMEPAGADLRELRMVLRRMGTCKVWNSVRIPY